MKIKKQIEKFLPICISITILFFLFHKINIKDIEINTMYWLPAMFVFVSIVLAYLFRSYSYQKLLSKKNPISIFLLYKITGIYNFLSSLFPFGVGHLSYPYFVKKHIGISYVSAFNSLFIYNIIRVTIFIIMLSSTSFYIINVNTIYMMFEDFYNAKMNLILILSALFVILSTFIVSNKVFNEDRLNLLDKFYIIFRVDIRMVPLTLLLSILVVTFNIINIYCSYIAFGVSLPISSVMFLLSLNNLSSFLPIHAASSIGSYELINSFGLILIGFESSYAIQLSFAVHLLGLLFQALVALFCYNLLKFYKRNRANV